MNDLYKDAGFILLCLLIVMLWHGTLDVPVLSVQLP